MEILFLLAGLAVGFLLAFLLFQLKGKGSGQELQTMRTDYEKELARQEEKSVHLQKECDQLAIRLDHSESENEQQIKKLATAEADLPICGGSWTPGLKRSMGCRKSLRSNLKMWHTGY
ncbi:MAG: hypothetical protein PHI28_18445 [Mangrovibacterium sp.]|nr:hypothetical protein [Mangrovibacterium sp.]